MAADRDGLESVEDVACTHRSENHVVLLIPILAIVLQTICHFLGGHPWTFLISVSLVSLGFIQHHIKRFSLIGLSLIWMFISRLTGHRELFFPFAMFLATYVAVFLSDRHFWMGWLGGFIVVCCFIAIRFQQRATFRVLLVELIAATVILACTLIVDSVGWKTLASRFSILAFASFVAFCCLAI